MMFGSCVDWLLFVVVVTVVLVVVEPPAGVFDPPVVGAWAPAAGRVSTGAEVTDVVVDDTEAVLSTADCLDGAQPPTITTAAMRDAFAILIDCSSHCACSRPTAAIWRSVRAVFPTGFS